MKRRRFRPLLWCCLAGGCLLQSCTVIPGLDPDLTLRAGLSVVSDAAVFLLQNLAASL